MKNIKTYEGFKGKIFDYEDQIDSFLDDLKDISIGSHKIIDKKTIVYCFCIRKYDEKFDEIEIFLDEIKSACKFNNINFMWCLNSYYSINYLSSLDKRVKLISNIRIKSKSNEDIDYIVLYFYNSKNISMNYFNWGVDAVEKCANKLGFACKWN